MSAKPLIILGAGGMARETAWIIEEINHRSDDQKWEIVGFWQDNPQVIGSLINGYPVLDPNRIRAQGAYAVAAIGKPSIRFSAVQQARQKGLSFATLIHPDVHFDQKTVKIGEGVIICPGIVITVNVTIGDHVIVNVSSTISHDCIIEDYVTISPGCHLAGYTVLEEQSFLGIGAVTIENHRVGKQAIVGAGSVVIRDVPQDTTVVGVPAKAML